MELREILDLVAAVSSQGISELEVEREGFRLRIVRAAAKASAPLESAPSVAASVSVERIGTAAAAAAAPVSAEDGDLYVMRSPIVGTFYRSASPSAEPYAKIADRVKKGQVVCIIEAMKLMNEIECEVSGVVSEILVEDGQPVEYGEPLYRIRQDR